MVSFVEVSREVKRLVVKRMLRKINLSSIVGKILRMKCYLDKDRFNVIESEGVDPMIVEYLTTEIRSSIHSLKVLIANIHCVENHQLPSFGQAGNAYYIEVSRERIMIGCDYTESETSLSHTEVLEAFFIYLDYLVNTYKSK